jgi:hypothetical protein
MAARARGALATPCDTIRPSPSTATGTGCRWLAQQFGWWADSRGLPPTPDRRLQQGARDQLHAVAVAAGDEYLRRRAIDPARQLQIGCNGDAQFGQAGPGRVDHVVRSGGAHGTRGQPRPHLARKGVQRRYAHLEGQGGAGGIAQIIVRRQRMRGGVTAVRRASALVTTVPACPRAST